MRSGVRRAAAADRPTLAALLEEIAAIRGVKLVHYSKEGCQVTEKGGVLPTLELVAEIKIRKLLPKVKGKSKKKKKRKKLEASGVVYQAGYFYVVFDNRLQVARIQEDLQKGDNRLFGRKKGKGGYEGITYDQEAGVFHTVVEIAKPGYQPRAVVADEQSPQPANGQGWPSSDYYHGWIHTYDPKFRLLGEVRLDYRFDRDDFKDNKGFEGLTWICRDGCSYLLALCEGERRYLDDGGNGASGGAIQVYRKEGNGWAFSRELRIPEVVQFKDYSGLGIRHGKVALVSQQESALWVSTLEDDWTLDEGRIYRFPTTPKKGKKTPKKGKKTYCNVEGVSWINDTRIVVVSDSRKKGDPPRSKKKQQSIHIFDIPS